MFLVVGLGNPGKDYEQTRHNIGFMVIDRLLQLYPCNEKKEKKALTYKLNLFQQEVLFVKPQTYMNLSGESVVPLMSYYKIPSERLLVLHDDVDLEFSRMKFQISRGHGGQNGIRNIHQLLGHNNYMRLKLGVGRPPHPSMNVADWVLGKFSKEEHAELGTYLDKAAQAVEAFLQEGPQKAMEEFNRK